MSDPLTYPFAVGLPTARRLGGNSDALPEGCSATSTSSRVPRRSASRPHVRTFPRFRTSGSTATPVRGRTARRARPTSSYAGSSTSSTRRRATRSRSRSATGGFWVCVRELRGGSQERPRRQPHARREPTVTVAEYRAQRRATAQRHALARQLAQRKARREESERRTRSARESAAWAVQHHLPPERIYEPQPRVQMPAFGGLRPSPRPEELARRSRRVDAILQSLW